MNNIEKKLEFVLRINYGFEKSIDFNLYTFILNDKMYFLSVYGDKDDANFDLYNFCNVWRVKENIKENVIDEIDE